MDNEKLERIINEAQIPRTPKSILDNLILDLYKHQTHVGAPIVPDISNEKDHYLNRLYFENIDEYLFYLRTLKEQSFISFSDTPISGGRSYISDI